MVRRMVWYVMLWGISLTHTHIHTLIYTQTLTHSHTHSHIHTHTTLGEIPMPVAPREEAYGYILFIGTNVAYSIYFAFAVNASRH